MTDLVELGEDISSAITQDHNIITNTELKDIVNTQDIIDVNNSSDADATDNDNIYVDDESPIVTTPIFLTVTKFMGTCGINLILPFINGMMLGFGEILAHELAFKYGWYGAKVYPTRRMITLKNKSHFL